MLKMLLVDCNQIIQRHLSLKPTFYATFPVTVLDDGWKSKDLSVVAISFTLEVSISWLNCQKIHVKSILRTNSKADKKKNGVQVFKELFNFTKSELIKILTCIPPSKKERNESNCWPRIAWIFGVHFGSLVFISHQMTICDG